MDVSGVQGFRIPERLQDKPLGILLSRSELSSTQIADRLVSFGYFVDVIRYSEGEFIYFSRSSYTGEDITRDALYFLFIALMALVPLGVLSFFLTQKILRPLEESLIAMQDFVSDAGHELKTPLSSALLELDLLERFSGETPESQSIRSRLSQSAHLIDTLGDLSLLTHHHKVRVHTPIIDCITDVREQLSALIEERGVTLETHGMEWSIPIPREQGYLLLKNLIENAIKYSPKDSVVCIAFAKDTLTITDHGIGMDLDTQDRMFDRFYRRDRNTSDGSGIGLAIVEKITKIYHIKISVISALGEGTEISLRFPFRSCLPPSSRL